MQEEAREVFAEILAYPGEGGRKCGVENMDDMEHLHEAAILDNLRLRFAKDLIYTSTGPILIAMNPFKMLPLYTDEVVARYRGFAAEPGARSAEPRPPSR